MGRIIKQLKVPSVKYPKLPKVKVDPPRVGLPKLPRVFGKKK